MQRKPSSVVIQIKEILNSDSATKVNMLQYLVAHDEGINADFFKSKEWKNLKTELETEKSNHPNDSSVSWEALSVAENKYQLAAQQTTTSLTAAAKPAVAAKPAPSAKIKTTAGIQPKTALAPKAPPKPATSDQLIYKSLDGKIYTSDEAKNVRQAKNPDGTPLEDKSPAADYCAESWDETVGLAGVIGERDAQENRVVVQKITVSEMQGVKQESLGSLLAETFTALHEGMKSKYVPKVDNQAIGSFADGTCAIACAIQGDQVHVANMGDSTAFIVVLDNGNNVSSCSRVNNLHNIAVESEQLTIKTALLGTSGKIMLTNPMYLSKGRIFGGFGGVNALNISRTIGDFEYESDYIGSSNSGKPYCLISRSPEVHPAQTVKIPSGGKAFVITACQGLTEGIGENYTYKNKDKKTPEEEEAKRKLDEAYVKAGIEAAIKVKKTKPAEMAVFLAQRAQKEEGSTEASRENISVVVNEINPKSKDIKLVAVFDGHDGSDVSAECQARFVESFKQRCELQKTQAAKEKISADVPAALSTPLADTVATAATTSQLPPISLAQEKPNQSILFKAAVKQPASPSAGVDNPSPKQKP